MEVRVGLNALIIAVTRDQPRVMTIPYTELAALPFGDLDSEGDRTLELALRRWVRQQTGLELGYVEQLYSFGDRARDRVPGVRMISIAYLALVREEAIPPKVAASWRNVYDFLPWEDWRKGPPDALNKQVAAALKAGEMRLRSQITFGLEGAPWDGNRALERYELLYELGLVQESQSGAPPQITGLGEAMALDHRRMLATALARIRGKLRYRPVIFEMLPEEFTLLQLQKAVEALSGVPVHKQNFRRLVEQGGLVEGTGQLTRSIGRPAELFHFRREVLRERPAPGVGLPRQV
ncbi:MAG: NAD regulator [Candidatus Eremiobacteraeota bacterium]|nr:NAD regulator [Candidatus Eremiobacteraeota bacterium]MCW5870639.1 NAD regulator [Candidatus Eremiobacteraeota bacterium]